MELDQKELRVIKDIMEQINQYSKEPPYASIQEFINDNQKYNEPVHNTLLPITDKKISLTTYFTIKDNHINTLEFGTEHGKIVDVDLPESALELEYLDNIIYHFKKPSPLLTRLKIKKLRIGGYDTKLIRNRPKDKKYEEAITEYNNKALSLITKIESLEELTLCMLGDNKIYIELPKGFSKLKNLNKLDITSSHIKELPQTMRELRNLRELTLRCTKISELPVFLNELKNLEFLNISDLSYDGFNNLNTEFLERLKIKIDKNSLIKVGSYYLLNKDLILREESWWDETDKRPVRVESIYSKRELVEEYFDIKGINEETLEGLLLRGLIKKEREGTKFIKLVFPEFNEFIKQEIENTNSEVYKTILVNLTQNF